MDCGAAVWLLVTLLLLLLVLSLCEGLFGLTTVSVRFNETAVLGSRGSGLLHMVCLSLKTTFFYQVGEDSQQVILGLVRHLESVKNSSVYDGWCVVFCIWWTDWKTANRQWQNHSHVLVSSERRVQSEFIRFSPFYLFSCSEQITSTDSSTTM